MQIKETLTLVEEKFNIAGCIPIVGFISGSLRCVAGKIQFYAGLILAGASLAFQFTLPADKVTWEKITADSLQHVVHGGLNVMRGFVEALISFTFIGNAALIAAQCSLKTKFKPILPYTTTS